MELNFIQEFYHENKNEKVNDTDRMYRKKENNKDGLFRDNKTREYEFMKQETKRKTHTIMFIEKKKERKKSFLFELFIIFYYLFFTLPSLHSSYFSLLIKKKHMTNYRSNIFFILYFMKVCKECQITKLNHGLDKTKQKSGIYFIIFF